MLADASEASVRALTKPSSTAVEAAVRGIVDGRLADGQLDNAGLALRDLDRIVAVYARMLVSMYHARCEYPQPVKTQGVNASADQHHEPSGA
jgi:membrane-associated HD superfamily phosphohydrolase